MAQTREREVLFFQLEQTSIWRGRGNSFHNNYCLVKGVLKCFRLTQGKIHVKAIVQTDARKSFMSFTTRQIYQRYDENKEGARI